MNDSTRTTSPQEAHDQARLLSEALPFMQRYENKSIVVKYGGAAMGDPALAQAFARDIALLKQSGVNPVVVHGGGPQIGEMLKKLGIKSEFRGGLRVTDKATVEIVEMVLAGSSTRRSSRSSTRKASGQSGFPARTAIWCSPRRRRGRLSIPILRSRR